ncbi:MAG: error-prone DNA polymerase [Bdellovibrionaceae bacterium]|nr:error-prone DNA polymerase [Pseudobdellovibrionaceae bacterium]
MYAELKSRTNYTFLEGSSSPEELVERAIEIGLEALAITDRNGVYALPKAYWFAKESPRFKLICGSELLVEGEPPITLIASSRASYGVMCRILTAAHHSKEKGSAFITAEELKVFSSLAGFSGLFCLTEPRKSSQILKTLFGDKLYLTLARFKDGKDRSREQSVLEHSRLFNIPVVATNDVLFHKPSRKDLQDCFTCIREGRSLDQAGFKLLPNRERYLKSPFEMMTLFKDMPEVVRASQRIADQCQFSLSELKYRYPTEWIPQNHSAQSYLEELTWRGAQERYSNRIPEKVIQQIHHEFALIRKLGYADYFLTIFDIVDFARKKDILCQGRGSAANSVICFCLGITAIDPVKMNLLFERFISEERNEPPDIDVDFEHERREEVIQYIYQKYGRDRAAMVSAVVTYQKRSALRELFKAFGIDVGTLSAKKLVKDFDNYVKQSPVPNCKEHIDRLSSEMAGFPRHISIHSGGFTLSADPITEIVPVEPARMEGRSIIQWDKYDLDYLGLLKIDVLALGMLTALQKTLKDVGMELYQIPHEDKETYKMIQVADTVGTFQVESRAQMNMSGRLQPKTFYDLVVQVAIVRPGPIVGQMVHPYLRRRQGKEPVTYPHPKLKEILGRTLGVPLFQEQLMKIAIDIGHFTAGEADRLRRAIGAWRASGSIEKVTQKLYTGLISEGIPREYALNIIEHMKGFAHYGFPESHAASFALLSYASCYLKRHHPAEFACGLLNSQPMGFYAPHSLLDDAKTHGVCVLPVSPNESQFETRVVKRNTLRVGLKMVRGLSQKNAEAILQSRPYSSLSDFLSKTNLPSDVLLQMAMGDAFREFGEDQRHTLWRILEERIKPDTQADLLAGSSSVQQSLFKGMDEFEQVRHEYDAFGLSTKNHPIAALRQIVRLPKMTSYDVKRCKPKTTIKTSGLLLVRQKPPTANGVCFAAMEDEYGFVDMVLFSKVYERFKDVFLHNSFFEVTGVVERDGHSLSLIVKSLKSIELPNSQSFNADPSQYFW